MPQPQRKGEHYHGKLYNASFDRQRKAFLNERPLCATCGHSATVLDHIRPHRGNLALFWDQTNWQGLCYRCHGKKTALETWGRGTAAPELPQEPRSHSDVSYL